MQQVWQANDGQCFTEKADCEYHEEGLEIRHAVREAYRDCHPQCSSDMMDHFAGIMMTAGAQNVNQMSMVTRRLYNYIVRKDTEDKE